MAAWHKVNTKNLKWLRYLFCSLVLQVVSACTVQMMILCNFIKPCCVAALLYLVAYLIFRTVAGRETDIQNRNRNPIAIRLCGVKLQFILAQT